VAGEAADCLPPSAPVSCLVEVKCILSSEDDLERGIYQCLKYRVAPAAHLEKRLDTDEVIAIFVTEVDLPPDLAKLAKRVGSKDFKAAVRFLVAV
jgi:hypothetical protein